MDSPRLFSPHGLVLLLIFVRPGITAKEIADSLVVTYRTVWGLVGDLRRAGLVKVRKEGRRHHYYANTDAQFPHPLMSHMTLGDVVEAIRP